MTTTPKLDPKLTPKARDALMRAWPARLQAKVWQLPGDTAPATRTLLRRHGLIDGGWSLTPAGVAMRLQLLAPGRDAQGTVTVPVWALREVLASARPHTEHYAVLRACLDAAKADKP